MSRRTRPPARSANSSGISKPRSAGPRNCHWSDYALEEQRFDALRLLRLIPAITELARIDPSGHEQLHVSRLTATVIGGNADLSAKPEFVEAMAHKAYYGPVYFRRETEPYMTLAVTGPGMDSGVTVAEISLKYIWDVVSGIKVGNHGAAYVVDADGKLIAHPDLGLVLRNTDLSGLAQVRAAQAPDIARGSPERRRGYVGTAGAHRPRGDRAAGLARLRRAADRRGLRPPLCLAEHPRRRAPGRARPGGPVEPRARQEDGAADPRAAGRRRPHRRGRARSPHRDHDRRRAGGAGRSVQRHGGAAAGFLRHARRQGDRAHPAARARQPRQDPLPGGGEPRSAPAAARARSPGRPAQCRHQSRRAAPHRRPGRHGGLGDERSVQRVARHLQARCRRRRARRHRLSDRSAAAADREHVRGRRARRNRCGCASLPSDAWVRSDRVLLERIVLNLVSNAVRYTERGGIVVGCRRRGAALRIEVWDSGIGIPEDQRQNIFGEFYQVDGAKRAGPGWGSASPSWTACAACSHHPLELTSTPGRGSRFSITRAAGARASRAGRSSASAAGRDAALCRQVRRHDRR